MTIVNLFHYCSAPFTIQRLCELITNPQEHYKSTDKFMRGLEKVRLYHLTVHQLISGCLVIVTKIPAPVGLPLCTPFCSFFIDLYIINCSVVSR